MLLKADNTGYADADLIALTNNGLVYLFSSMKLTLNLTIPVRLHHFSVWRPTRQTIQTDVD